MTTDRELLEKAAKAAGIDLVWHLELDNKTPFCLLRSGGLWNPLTDDGDALRLAVKLRMEVVLGQMLVSALVRGKGFAREAIGVLGPCEATRRAIVRAAAAIGEKT